MNHARCERTWQAEAREDGRLEPRDLASFERHAPLCKDCTAEIAALQKLAQQMANVPEPVRTDLEHRRARQDLLRRANDEVVATKPAVKIWKTVSLVGAMALGLSGILWIHSQRNTRHIPTFDVVDVTNAVWQSETIASTSRVALQSGTAAFHVEHLESNSRFLVEMPDGNIEVRGTRFIVDVANGHTRSVDVTEGLVWLDVPQFHGLLHAGERWPKVETNATGPTSSAKIAAQSVESEPANRLAEDAGVAVTSAPVATNSGKSHAAAMGSAAMPDDGALATASAPLLDGEAGPRFAEAMQAFTSGDDVRADQLFAAFVRDFPRDGRAEDATFLRAKARARRGDTAGAKAVAREYLRAFPRGLRRPEAERLAGEEK
jgi:FecR protein